MPELRAQLLSGDCGARWVPPDGAEAVTEEDDLLILRDPAAKIVWRISTSLFPFALDAAHDEVLRNDLEMSAREAFDNAWKPPDEGEPPARRRTEDTAWSPVIEQSRLDLPGGTALRLLRRTSYQPGKEVIVGQLIVPTAIGHVDFWAIAQATVTGVRETLVRATMTQGQKSGSAAVEPDAEVLASEDDGAIPTWFPQAVYDDPDLDARFPEHPLTLVRQAVRKLCDSVTITRAAPRIDDVVHLKEPKCAFAVPPRYVPVPAKVTQRMGMPPTLRILMRLGLESWHRNLEVRRLEGVRLQRGDVRSALCTLARDTVAGWSQEGATDIKTSTEPVDDFRERPQIRQWVRMNAEGNPTRSLFRWWIEPDGVVFRLGSNGPLIIPDTEHVALLDRVQASWHRLDAVGPSRRPWWRIW
jgi:hypothetical protein